MPKHHHNELHKNNYYYSTTMSCMFVCVALMKFLEWKEQQQKYVRKTSQRIKSIQSVAHRSHSFPMKQTNRFFYFPWANTLITKGATTWHFVPTWIAFQWETSFFVFFFFIIPFSVLLWVHHWRELFHFTIEINNVTIQHCFDSSVFFFFGFFHAPKPIRRQMKENEQGNWTNDSLRLRFVNRILKL